MRKPAILLALLMVLTVAGSARAQVGSLIWEDNFDTWTTG